MLRAPVNGSMDAFSSLLARDDFAQTAGNLNAKVSSSGHTWATSGGTGDFQVSGSGVVTRATDDNTGQSRLAVLSGTSFGAVAVQADIQSTLWTSGSDLTTGGVVARRSGSSDLTAAIGWNSLNGYHALTIDSQTHRLPFVLAPDTAYSVRLVVDTAGRWFVWVWDASANTPPDPVATGLNTGFATGGANATGSVGIWDYSTALTRTRTYDHFAVWTPTFDAVAYASQSVELRTDGMFREDSTGTASGPVSWVQGDLPRRPVSGLEGRTVRVIVKASRGDFDALPDTGIDDLSVRVYYRPAWLVVPGS